MKHLIIYITFILLPATVCLAQGTDSLNHHNTSHKTSKKASFITTIDIRHATKDGMYLEGYVVNIPYEKAKALDGKTVRVSGKVRIVKAIQKGANGEEVQGRQVDTKHILHPRIEVVSD